MAKILLWESVQIDFLTLRLNKNNINSLFWGLVDNSNYIDTTNLFWIGSKLNFDALNDNYRLYSILDNQNNKLASIMIINQDKEKNASYLYDNITFYGDYFNLYGDFLDVSLYNIFSFFGVNENTKITRIDIKQDVPYVPFFYDKFLKSNKMTSVGESYKNYRAKYSWQNKADYELRIYDKLLDVLDKNKNNICDNFWNFPYNEMLKNLDILYRVEFQINARYIKKYNYIMSDIFKKDWINYDFLKNIFIRKCSHFLTKNTMGGVVIPGALKKYIRHTKIAYNRQIEHTKTMFEAYWRKLFYLDKEKVKNSISNLYIYDFSFLDYNAVYKINIDLKNELNLYKKRYWLLKK